MKTSVILLVFLLCLSEAVSQADRESLSDLEQKVKRLELRMNSMVNMLDPAQLADERENFENSLRAEMNVTNHKMEGLARQNAEMASKTEDLKTELSASNTKIEDLKTELSASNTKIEDLKTELSASNTKIEDLQTKVQQLHLRFCPNGWKMFGPSCYYLTTVDKSWREGRAECQSYGADLVIVNSKEEQDFIRVLRPGDSSWIGLSRSSMWDEWTWVNRSPLTPPTVYWYSGGPSIHQQSDCVAYWHNTDPGTWYNLPCSFTRPSICEK